MVYPLKSAPLRRIILAITTMLVAVGLLAVYSSSCVYALERFASPFYFVLKQVVGISIGALAIAAIQFIPISYLKKGSFYFFLCSVALTALTLVPGFGVRVYGSGRWLKIAGFSFQPSELLKIGLVLFMAQRICIKEKKYSFIYGLLPLLLIAILPSIVLLLQPDFGLTVTLMITALSMLYLSNFQLKHLGYTLLSCLPFAFILVLFKPYRLKRILVFLNPWNDPHGSGFQIIQSLIAIGSGGMWGVGISHSKQKFYYLPMQHTDFIFSIIAEEVGFVGSALLVLLYALLLYYGFRLAQGVRDEFCKLAIQGFTILISLQAIINISVASGLLPTKGLGLPFISYGNSALVCYLVMIGLMIRCSKVETYTH